MKRHEWDTKKPFKKGETVWIPAACGTRIAVSFYSHFWRSKPINCKKCLARKIRND